MVAQPGCQCIDQAFGGYMTYGNKRVRPGIHAYKTKTRVTFVFSRIRAAVSTHRDLHIEQANFLNIDLTDADLVVCYQSPSTISRLRFGTRRSSTAPSPYPGRNRSGPRGSSTSTGRKSMSTASLNPAPSPQLPSLPFP